MPPDEILEQRQDEAAPAEPSDMAVKTLPRAQSKTPRTLSEVTASPSTNLERMSVNAAEEELMTVVDIIDVIPME